MPHKHNPVLSVLIRRAALTTPQLAATLHLAAAQQVDERADGAWHAEWATLRDLVRRTLVAASQTVDLLAGLQVDRRPDGGDPARRARAGARRAAVAWPSWPARSRSFAYLGDRRPSSSTPSSSARGDARRAPIEATP